MQCGLHNEEDHYYKLLCLSGNFRILKSFQYWLEISFYDGIQVLPGFIDAVIGDKMNENFKVKNEKL